VGGRLKKAAVVAAPVAHVALLRAVNVGGRMLPMKDLAAMFTAAGAANVRTYIASGNVVFAAAPAAAVAIARDVEAAITTKFGYAAPIVLRTAEELAAATAANPYVVDHPLDKVYVGFLAEAPAADRLALLDPDRSPPDRYRVVGREVYMALAVGAAKTKLTVTYFDSVLATTMTVRNWRTTTTLAELAAQASGSR
jgi:uncharacterized protein (DUF1697 family)